MHAIKIQLASGIKDGTAGSEHMLTPQMIILPSI
jgi:hypothetical protein